MRDTDCGDVNVPRIRETVITAAEALCRTLYRLPERGVRDGSPHFQAFDGSQRATRAALRELQRRLSLYLGDDE